MVIRRLVVGVDASAPSRAAIRWATAHAAGFDAEVLLVHVADDEWGTVGSVLIDEVDDQAGRTLSAAEAFARSLHPDVPVRTELRRGSPMVELAAFSEPGTALVVGTHKTGFHYGRAFGSRSLQLANLATGPVAVIPGVSSRLRSGVVVGVDDTPAGEAAVDLAADLAASHACELLAVRSSGASTAVDIERDDQREDWQRRRDDDARALMSAVLDRARRRQPAIVIRARVVRRPAGMALNELARSAELLVIGDSRRAEARLGTLGAVAYDVLLNVSSPTIVVHAPLDVERVDARNTEGEHDAIG
ncbi:universal stress protein [Leifsonia sp. WHRI 6310E]|uniref:universal stress protein n=1 Tax=Leifsonia sp. WHRI 6310E TaxID=3162562 RepID=UPI0032ECA0F4